MRYYQKWVLHLLYVLAPIVSMPQSRPKVSNISATKRPIPNQVH